MDNRQQEQEEQQQWLVYEKLQKARVKLQNIELKKSGHNKFAGYRYFELTDFLPTVNSIFAELKLCHTLEFTSDLATMRVIDTEDGGCAKFTCPMASAVSFFLAKALAPANTPAAKATAPTPSKGLRAKA